MTAVTLGDETTVTVVQPPPLPFVTTQVPVLTVTTEPRTLSAVTVEAPTIPSITPDTAPNGEPQVVVPVVGPAGPPGSSYSHQQTIPAATWTVQHNLHRKPAVVLFLDENPAEPVYTDVTYPDADTVVIEWPTAVAGWVEI